MKTNNLKFNTQKEITFEGQKATIYVKIRLNDECKNGHQDFAITGDIYKGSGKSDRSFLTGGCIHDEIAKYFPEFKTFIDLHLCDFNGVPMHAISNGHYHMKNGYFSEYKKETPEEFKKHFCEYYRITPREFDELKKAKDQNYFGFLLQALEIPKKWKKEAEKAIKYLEELTGDDFINDSVKTQLDLPSEEKMQEIKEKVSSGYYSDEAIETREKENKEAAKSSKLQKLEDSFKATNLKSLRNYEIDKLGINLFGTDSNIIYYDYTGEVIFNWSNSSYDKKYTSDEFEKFRLEAQKIEVLKPLTFKLK